MNKKDFTLFAAIVIMYGVYAQDTLSADTLKSSYYCNQWFDFNGANCILMTTGNLVSSHEKVEGKLVDLDNDDTIIVYGIAVGADTYTLPIRQSAIFDNAGELIGYFDDSTEYYRELNSMCDTSAHEDAYELWGLYRRVSDTLQRVSPQLPINIKLHEPSYILTFSTYDDGSCTEHTKPLAVYELFFHTPVAMSGSFYMAVTNRIKAKGSLECKRSYYTWPIFRRLLLPSGISPIYEGHAWYESEITDGLGVFHPAHWVFNQHSAFTYVFPIIAPPDSGYVWDTTVVAGDTVFAAGDTIVIGANDTIIAAGDTTVIVGDDTVFVAGGSAIVTDTTIISDTVIVQDTAVVGGDTIVYFDTIIHSDTVVIYDVLLSISEADMLGRLTVVKPNPATGTARVISSIGMSRVEACNMAGKRVLDRPVVGMGLSTTIDVSSWPAGTYILRIHTPQGIATKKLTVAR